MKPDSIHAIRKQKGTVLITVLLVVAFVVLLVVQVNKTVTYQANLNRNLMNRDQAYAYLNGMEELAKIYLKKAFENEKDENVNLGQAWAQQDITFPIDGGAMTASIIDMQSCFNLNSIGVKDKSQQNGAGRGDNSPTPTRGNPIKPVTPAKKDGQSKGDIGEDIFTTLLEKALDNSQVQPAALSAEVKDWIDTDQTPSGPDGAEDLYYQGLDFPYLPPNGSIAHVSELMTIKSFNRQIYAAIRPYICVLPSGEDNKLNVNTILAERSALLYAALGGKIAQSKVDEAISARPEKGYDDMQAFWLEIGDAGKVKKGLKQRLDITSRYFQMQAKAEVGRTRVYLKTLFIKEDDNNFKVVSRYFGKE